MTDIIQQQAFDLAFTDTMKVLHDEPIQWPGTFRDFPLDVPQIVAVSLVTILGRLVATYPRTSEFALTVTPGYFREALNKWWSRSDELNDTVLGLRDDEGLTGNDLAEMAFQIIVRKVEGDALLRQVRGREDDAIPALITWCWETHSYRLSDD